MHQDCVAEAHRAETYVKLRCMLLAARFQTASTAGQSAAGLAFCDTWARQLCVTRGIRAVAHSAMMLAKGQ